MEQLPQDTDQYYQDVYQSEYVDCGRCGVRIHQDYSHNVRYADELQTLCEHCAGELGV